jgi:hypothetical protein
MMRTVATVLGLLVVDVATAAWANGCPYLPAFEAVRQQLPSLAPAAALAELERLSAGDENPLACESIEMARLMSEQETQLVFLVDGLTRIPEQASVRCGRLDIGDIALRRRGGGRHDHADGGRDQAAVVPPHISLSRSSRTQPA